MPADLVPILAQRGAPDFESERAPSKFAWSGACGQIRVAMSAGVRSAPARRARLTSRPLCHQKIARLLSDPGTGGVRGDAEEVDAAGGVLHDEQHLEPLQQHRIDAEEGRRSR